VGHHSYLQEIAQHDKDEGLPEAEASGYAPNGLCGVGAMDDGCVLVETIDVWDCGLAPPALMAPGLVALLMAVLFLNVIARWPKG